MTLVGGYRETDEPDVRPADEPAAPALAGRGHDLAMRTFFAPPSTKVPIELYAKIDRGAASRHRSAVTVHPHSSLSTSTYFGRFPASYWQRWTAVTEVTVRAAVTGSGLVRVMASDSHGGSRALHAEQVEHPTAEMREWTVPVDRFADGGAIWLELDTEEASLLVSDVTWRIAPPERARPTSVVMCTHNRAEDCLATLRTLAGDPVATSRISEIQVVDQGTDTVAARPAFAEVQATLGDKLRYRTQPNLGGAGGFTRGLLESLPEHGEANALFIDDDILLEPDTLLRLASFADSAVEPIVVGAQMLQLLHPYRLHVSAETARFTTIEPGLAVDGGLSRADLREKSQDRRVDADYNAWWCCLLPSEIVRDAGLPMPMFFQWDDVEFGYRIRSRGHATVTLPGAAVWHADFDWKDEDSWVRYFTLRNALIIDALHGNFDGSASAKAFLKWVGQCLVSMRYAQAELLILAVRDFLTGPRALDDGGLDALARINELRSRHPETERHHPSRVPLRGSSRPIAKAGPSPAKAGRVFAKRLAWQLLGKTRGTASIAARDAHWWHVGLFQTAVVTDASQESVAVRRLDRGELKRIGGEALRVALRLHRNGNRAHEEWRAGHATLTDRKNWARLFDAAPRPRSSEK